MPDTERTRTVNQEQAPAIGESLRILSVFTRFGATGSPAVELDLSRNVVPGADFRALFHLLRLVRRYKPDIIHTYPAKPGAFGRLAGTPLITHIFHGNVLRGYLSLFGNWCIEKIEQVLAASREVLCVVSRRQHREIARECHSGASEKARIVPLSLPLDEFATLPPPPLERNEFIVAWFGRLVAVKNIPLLIAVVEQSLPAIPNICFIIAGEGPERAAVKSLVDRSAGRVEFLGWQREVAPVIARADVLIQTSLNEGTPTSLIQGMAAARPFISTDVGGVGDMVTGEERLQDRVRWFTNGALVAQDASAFVSALQALAQNRALLSQIGLVGRRWAMAHYAESKVSEATHRLYSEYLSAEGHHLPPPLPPQLAREFSMTQQLSRLAHQIGPLPQSNAA